MPNNIKIIQHECLYVTVLIQANLFCEIVRKGLLGLSIFLFYCDICPFLNILRKFH